MDAIAFNHFLKNHLFPSGPCPTRHSLSWNAQGLLPLSLHRSGLIIAIKQDKIYWIVWSWREIRRCVHGGDCRPCVIPIVTARGSMKREWEKKKVSRGKIPLVRKQAAPKKDFSWQIIIGSRYARYTHHRTGSALRACTNLRGEMRKISRGVPYGG